MAVAAEAAPHSSQALSAVEGDSCRTRGREFIFTHSEAAVADRGAHGARDRSELL